MNWISVERFTPKNGSIVLVRGMADSPREISVVGIAIYHHSTFSLNPLDGKGFTRNFCFILNPNSITHWMPLPDILEEV